MGPGGGERSAALAGAHHACSSGVCPSRLLLHPSCRLGPWLTCAHALPPAPAQAKDPFAAAAAVGLGDALPTGPAGDEAKLRKKQLKVGGAGWAVAGMGGAERLRRRGAWRARTGLLATACRAEGSVAAHACAPLPCNPPPLPGNPSPHPQELGRARARQLGWQDAYTYSKSIAGKQTGWLGWGEVGCCSYG